MDFDLELVSSFLVLVDISHYGRASRELHITAPTLTKRIQRLERQLGVRLVDRGAEGVLGVTAAGLRFAAAARPLLVQAQAAAEAARAESACSVLRVGIPAGTADFLPLIGIAGIARNLRRAFPRLQLAVLNVPFPLLSRCLPEQSVDVLLTIAPVRHTAVDSFPLPIISRKLGIVDTRHVLAEATKVDVSEFCEQPLLYNPAIPEEWMSQFWLADLRSRQDARLVETHCVDHFSVMRDATARSIAMVGPEVVRRSLNVGLRGVILAGAAPLTFYAARHRRDRRAVVRAFVDVLQAINPLRLA